MNFHHVACAPLNYFAFYVKSDIFEPTFEKNLFTMKKIIFCLSAALLIIISMSCKKSDDESTNLEGDQSPMGQVGTTISSSSIAIAGVSDFNGTVVALNNGVSSYNGSAVVTNAVIKNMLSNVPQLTIKGDTVFAKDIQARSTTEGIEVFSGLRPGIMVVYGAGAGESWPIEGSSDKRTVISKSTDNDYPYGFMFIKVSQIDEPVTGALKSTTGLSKITYWANHRFGLVGVQFEFSDGSTTKFPLYTSTENK